MPWEDRIKDAYERSTRDLLKSVNRMDGSTSFSHVHSMWRALSAKGITGVERRKSCRETENASMLLWRRRLDKWNTSN